MVNESKSGSQAGKSHEKELRPWLFRNAYMLDLLGFSNFQDIRKILVDVDEEIDDDGHTLFYHVISKQLSFRKNAKISQIELSNYDDNIVQHLKKLNYNRQIPIKLKYFQYLAALFTELYLDRYFKSPETLINHIENYLIKYIHNRKSESNSEMLFDKFKPSMTDVRKCAYWMATGSGKTFQVILSYYQFKHYNHGPYKIDIDRILLITPNSDLSQQNLKELKLSGIPAQEFDSTALSGYFQTQVNETVNVIEITRFTEDKKDGGPRRLDIESFEKKNLVFVDEAHKGSGGKQWKRFRKELAAEGFTFEFSATFGQAAFYGDKEDSNNLVDFAKTILFDYSYPHFYEDGYGKEYRVLNVSQKIHDTERVLIANLLTYYEQKIVYKNNLLVAKEHNISDPLWIFVGSKVNVGKKSDVLKIVQFLNKYLKERDWAVKIINDLIKGRSGMIHDTTKHDIFSPAFPEQRLRYLRKMEMSPLEIYNDTLRIIFNCEEANGVTIVNIKNSAGEIGIRCGEKDFFADIYIGDSSKFLSIIQETEPDIPILHLDHSSLFKNIDNSESTINILIGAKKFIEGWDCFRVSCMGLMNIGKTEGTEIIQLFGRGVRLKGKNYSLKRSTNNDGNQHPDIPLLETLNIFGVEAKYVGNLKDFLKVEGVETENRIEKSIRIEVDESLLSEGLFIPRWEKGGFARRNRFILTNQDIVNVTVDLHPKVESEESNYFQGLESDTKIRPIKINPNYFEFVDWEDIFFSLLEYKKDKNMHNMLFTKETIRDLVMEDSNYTLLCPKHYIEPTSFEEVRVLENIIVIILKKMIQTAYGRKKNSWINTNSYTEILTKDHGNFNFINYVVKVRENEQEILTFIEKVSEDVKKFINSSNNKFISNVFYDKHLFQPLLTKVDKRTQKIIISPEGLNEGEERFVRDLKAFLKNNSDNQYLKDSKIFLLRNLPKSGVGFYGGSSWFYPDFIMWIKSKDNKSQRIIFIDPKGLTHMNNGFNDDKIRLSKDIKDLQEELRAKSESEIIMESFILSVTPKKDVKPFFNNPLDDEFDRWNVLFLEDSRYIEKILIN